MSREINRIQRTISLPLERLYITVQIHNKVVPNPLRVTVASWLHKKRLNLSLSGGRRQNDPSFGLNQSASTLVRSLITSSMFQPIPGKKKICSTKYCWIKYRSFFYYLGKIMRAFGVVNYITNAQSEQTYFWDPCRRLCCFPERWLFDREIWVSTDWLNGSWITFGIEEVEVSAILIWVLKHRQFLL